MSRIQRALRQIPKVEDAKSLSKPKYLTQQKSKKKGVNNFKLWVRSTHSEDIWAFSDSSLLRNGRSWWGYCLRQGKNTFCTNSDPFQRGGVYDVLLIGALKALEGAYPFATDGSKIFIFFDNKAAVQTLQTRISSSSSGVVRRIHELASTASVEIKWVPGRSKIKGN